jgi:hypothetical protein
MERNARRGKNSSGEANLLILIFGDTGGKKFGAIEMLNDPGDRMIDFGVGRNGR